MAQPALSRIVARLEREFGGSLFERIPAGVRPTRLGALVVERARRVLREIEEGENMVVAALAGRTGRFRVTEAPLRMQAVVAPAVQTFHAAFPEIEFRLRTAAWRDGVRRLADGRRAHRAVGKPAGVHPLAAVAIDGDVAQRLVGPPTGRRRIAFAVLRRHAPLRTAHRLGPDASRAFTTGSRPSASPRARAARCRSPLPGASRRD
ncbi:MAG: LysR family transcriptional regulator [Alphaproteobacteria bacterium]|nr:LysR family transcriptional regulator [Alphaproteobacteria bacterium]